jgi:aspartyl-tRNA synthetase
MLKYGSDKPDLRNPLVIVDVTDIFKREDVEFKAFKGIIDQGGVVRAIKAPSVADRPRSFFDKLNDWARGEGAPGLGYILFADGEGKGPIAKFVPEAAQEALKTSLQMQDGDAVFFVCDKPAKAANMAGKARTKIAEEMDIIEQGVFRLCWIVDFPMYEEDEKTGRIEFSHNPFSMPQGGMTDLEEKNPLEIYAHLYDCVCNGFELATGAIRNHRPDVMEKAFEIAGYDRSEIEKKFSGLYNAFHYGAPPHGGIAFGIDRIVMLLADEPNLREVYAFVMNGAYEDPMMGAPSEVTDEQLKELHLRKITQKAKSQAA